ncbi:TetM/TetW/TetO/TetS family tetracycline resistance ribosomal protection protein [Kitasatospora sp. NBC_01287]|uniref:elongation factor G n=1 Tax=Kitasatospora sp. NBC_01287 TaxID=2903573 RepID=UPI00224E778C|nr:TetM/TetW/TetO/TetS family tetracycline resistance ribosomal protection protein [Kitasatospora sp. NBC_01287]MCX4751068.1 TetM/TetW/TetO/TetS family tetracycline resistance ribosomal protection protein [Kitasatospora sp. NBC_01287]
MRILNLGILAHIDAGKTSLTERLLHTAGVIDTLGSVDDGSTQSDSMALERQRGITIKSAVVSFTLDDLLVNLIDTPGHPDFIAEVERVLGVLDGAVLVVSAVEGVQAQTRVLMRTLRRLGIPTLVFVNKIDRRGAREASLLHELGTRLSAPMVAMGRVRGAGGAQAGFEPFAECDAGFTARLAELLTRQDDSLLASFVADEAALTPTRLRGALAEQTRQARVHPVYFGSAVTGAGLGPLAAGLRAFLTTGSTTGSTTGTDVDGGAGPDHEAGEAVSGTVFKVERGPAGEKIAYVRLFAGTLRARQRVRFGSPQAGGRRDEGKVTATGVFEQGTALRDTALTAGRIGKVWGLGAVRVGDTLGAPNPRRTRAHFAPPTLESVVRPDRPSDGAALHTALTQLAEQDPLIDLRQDRENNELRLSLYGEVQKEVIAATLAQDYGLTVAFHESTTLYVERPAGTGAAVETMRQEPNPFLATIGLRVEPAPPGSGSRFLLGVEPGAMPAAFFKAVEETVHETLEQGLYGWQVLDCTITMTHSGYAPRQSHSHAVFDKSMSSTARDFRQLTPLVLMDALRRAGTRVHEPLQRFRLDLPADLVPTVLPELSRLGAATGDSTHQGASAVLEGTITAAAVPALRQRLPTLTSGEGTLECVFDSYQPVRAAAPERQRTGHNPLDRDSYLLRVLRRTTLTK